MSGSGAATRLQTKPTFKRPFYISVHARRRLRERFGIESDKQMEWLLNVQMQPPEIPDAANMNVSNGPALYYAILINDEPATAVVAAPPHADIKRLPRDPDVWPTVMTVYPGRKHIWQYQDRLRRKRGRPIKPFRPTWEEWEIETVALMRWIGYTLAEIAAVLGRTEKQLETQVWRQKIVQVQPRWTEEELQIACDMRFAGKTYAEIGRRLGKSEQAVKSKMLRHRRWVLEDPRRAAFLRIMYLLKHPGKLLRTMRDTDIIGRMAVLWEGAEGEEGRAS